jgi:ATP synthase protein I
MPFHRPTPDSNESGKGGGFLGAWVQAEKMMQIALLLPSAGFVGWLAGYWLDKMLHQTWIAMAGIVLGIISGLVGAVKMAIASAGNPKSGGNDKNGTESGNPDSQA